MELVATKCFVDISKPSDMPFAIVKGFKGYFG